jgi:hypothetical protein
MVFNKYNFKQTGGAEDKFLIYAILIAVIFFLFIMPMIEKYYNLENKSLVEKLENAVSPLRVDTNICSPSCCINSGWPVPNELKSNDIPEKDMKNYIPTNYSCNFGSNNGSGCVCLKKNDLDYLGSRGGNGVTGCSN